MRGIGFKLIEVLNAHAIEAEQFQVGLARSSLFIVRGAEWRPRHGNDLKSK